MTSNIEFENSNTFIPSLFLILIDENSNSLFQGFSKISKPFEDFDFFFLANSTDPGQRALLRALWSGSTLFGYVLLK